MFLLVSIDDNTRELTGKEFPTKEAAWEQMKEELLNINNQEFKDDYERDYDENGFVCLGDDYGIDSDSAWANADDGDLKCDWKIFSVNEKQ